MLPPNELTKPAASPRPCSEIAASCRPATQPSVLASSAATSSAEVEAHRLSEEVGGLGRGEAEVGAAHLGQLASGAQSRQGQRGILAGGDDQVHLGRQVRDQEGQRIVHRPGVEDVVVVEDEHDVARDGGEVVEQGREYRFEWRRLRGEPRTVRMPSPIPGATVCGAVIR